MTQATEAGPSVEVRRERVTRACTWYWSNRETIRLMLTNGPLEVPMNNGGTGFHLYQTNWNPECWIEKWENGDRRFSLEEAEELISDQMRPLFRVVRDRQFGTSEAIAPH